MVINQVGYAEMHRMAQDARREKNGNWKRWGPYLSDRQWGTVREDYSPEGDAWGYLPHDHARSRAYRWGEDGLLGITDRECRLCFALAVWNGQDAILKERLFGLTGPEGNHGEDVKECYYYLDSTPTHSYMKALYKYPQAAYPYDQLVAENHRRSREQPEFELVDTGVFDADRYFDLFVEYAKASPNDIAIRITVANRSAGEARLHLLPTLWFRNTWVWNSPDEPVIAKPQLRQETDLAILAEHETLGTYRLCAGVTEQGQRPTWLFTENETNTARLYQTAESEDCRKDAFHDYLVHGHTSAVNPAGRGTKAAAWYDLTVPGGGVVEVRLRLSDVAESPEPTLSQDFDRVFEERVAEADAFYAEKTPDTLNEDERRVLRQADAGLLWTKQFYHYVVHDWLNGDPGQPPPPAGRKQGRNHDWPQVYNRDVVSMPDKWEYPWYAAWDLAFHTVCFANLDAGFAKEQLVLFLREWYMHPNGQIPAYEFALGDVNPPVHAWACWRVYKMTGPRSGRDRLFLSRVFQKLLLNFTWWVNRKDVRGKNLFSGGFLGLDNIGIFDRSRPLPNGGFLEQADGTAWMAFYCVIMLAMSLELAAENPAYGDMASKFFEHFVAIADAMNTLDGTGLWDEADGFYYDFLHVNGHATPMRIRSMVGIIPLFAVHTLDEDVIDRLPGFRKRMDWFITHRQDLDLAKHISYMERDCPEGNRCGVRLLAIPSRERLERVLKYVLDENEFLSPYGVRSLSKVHESQPFTCSAGGEEHRVEYVPGESTSGLFGGNSNWRGPIWFPLNFLLIEALERYHHFYGDSLRVECPTGSGRWMNLLEVAREIESRLLGIFCADEAGRRPCHGDDPRYAQNPHWRNLLLFHEYFHGDTGRGLGAGHQTGWTALAARMLEDLGRTRAAAEIKAIEDAEQVCCRQRLAARFPQHFR